MKSLCFALILSQNSIKENSPPKHIQDLLKNRMTYQIKQENPDRLFYFDEASCNLVGTYTYTDGAIHIASTDQEMSLELAYSDILSGKKLELSPLFEKIETRDALVSIAAHEENLFEKNEMPSAQSNFKKWVPWIVAGTIGLAVGGYFLINQGERGGAGGSNPPPTRRQR